MLRLDRFLTIYLFHPLIRSKVLAGSRGIPILMYHSISEDLEPGLHPYYQISTSPRVFAEHMKFLDENGYSVLTLPEAVNRLKGGNHSDQKAVVLTFDDGFSDFYSAAFPILRRHGFPCTVFLPTAFIDNREATFRGKRCLSWDQVRELHRHGVAFGSHTVTHPQLASFDVEHIKTELEQSRKRIEAELHEDVDCFSYPFAFPQEELTFTETLRDLLQIAGYEYGVTTRIGISDGDEDSLLLKRIPVNGCDNLRLFEAKLDGAYGWVFRIQMLFRYLKIFTNHGAGLV